MTINNEIDTWAAEILALAEDPDVSAHIQQHIDGLPPTAESESLEEICRKGFARFERDFDELWTALNR